MSRKIGEYPRNGKVLPLPVMASRYMAGDIEKKRRRAAF